MARSMSEITSGFSDSKIDEMYDEGIRSGALGGKLLGAGGGGFMLFLVPPEKHDQIKTNLSSILHVPFKFDFSGSQIVYYSA